MNSAVLLAAACAAVLPNAFGQYYVASTVAGNGQLQFTGANGQAANALLVTPGRVAADAQGNIYFSETYYHQVFRVSQDGIITVVAGTGTRGFSGDNGPAAGARLDSPGGLAVGADGSLFIADSGNGRIRRVAGGIIATVYGDGRTAYSGDGGPASEAGIGGAGGLAFDAAGNLFISQPGQHVVRRVAANGTISTVAGNGTNGFSGDGGAATAAQLFTPLGIALDGTGNLYIADAGNNRVRRVAGGTITTFAGNGSAAFGNEGIPATQGTLAAPSDVTFGAGNIYIADTGHGHLRVVNAQGTISRFAGGGTSFENGPGAQASMAGIAALINDGRGGLIYADTVSRRIRRAALADAAVTTVAGVLPGVQGDNQLATSAFLLGPFGVTANAAGDVLIADTTDNRVRRVTPNGTITTAAGLGLFARTGDDGPANLAQVGAPRGLSIDNAGNLYIASAFGAMVRRVTPAGIITTLAGAGPGFAGDGGPATVALFQGLVSAVADANGNVFIADSANHRIRRIDGITGIVTTIAGDGTAAFTGDGGNAVNARLSSPRQLALDRNGNLLIADTGNHRIRRIAPNNTISTVAGNGETGRNGDGGPAAAAQLGSLQGVAVDGAGNIYVSHNNTVVRKIDAATGIIERIGGTGVAGFSGDNGLATNAMLSGPGHLAVNAAGEVLVVDQGNLRVRRLTPAQIVTEGVANGGTLRAGPVAPGEIVSIFGFHLGPSAPAGLRLEGEKVATEVAGTRVFFDNVPAPILYTSAGQVNVVVPYSVSGASTQVRVIYQGTATNTITVPVAASSPGIFAITNQDGAVNAASNRAARGSVVIFYATGEGQTNPPGIDGQVAVSVFPKPNLPVTVTIGGQEAAIEYVGAAPFFVAGVLQMNVRIPAGVTGNAALTLRIGDATLPVGTSIFVQ